MLHCLSISNLAAPFGSGGIAGKGQHMTILSALRERLSPPSPSVAPETASDGDALPFAGYDRLDDREVMKGLSDHSQVELEAVEGYERSHQDRKPVLDKLRYMRGREPLPGYDALSTAEVVAALEDANLATIKKVRGYERKFGKRHDVLEEGVRALHRHQAAHPAGPPPAYQPMSAASASAASPGGDLTENGDRP
jgi:hypothetical protein